MVELATDLFTWASLGTLTGLTGATVVVTNTAARAFDWSPKWLGLAVAMALCIGLAVVAKSAAADYVLALLNGCLVFLTAAGASAAGAAAGGQKPGGTLETVESTATESKPFMHRWF
jgi:hypothetical protein